MRWSTASGNSRHRFLETNRRLLEEAEELEHRARRRDIVVDEHTLFDFYDARVGAEVVSGAHFDQWWKRERRRAARAAHLRPGDAHPRHGRARSLRRLPRAVGQRRRGADLPDQLPLRARRGRGRPHHRRTRRDAEPGRGRRLLLERPRPARGAGHRLIRSLPKNLRVSFVPAPNKAKEFLAAVPAG